MERQIASSVTESDSPEPGLELHDEVVVESARSGGEKPAIGRLRPKVEGNYVSLGLIIGSEERIVAGGVYRVIQSNGDRVNKVLYPKSVGRRLEDMEFKLASHDPPGDIPSASHF